MDILFLITIVVLLILSISWLKVHPFLALLLFGLVFGIGSGLNPVEAVDLLLTGFANTLKWIAVIMILGAMIGEMANETGGAERIAHSTLKLSGEKRLPVAMGMTGYVISIPVFVDVAYIMMQSVTEALAVRGRRNILVVGLSLVAGLTATHALMPPTPGPLAVAGILEAQLGKVILINFFVALGAMAGGLAWATVYCRRIRVDYDDELESRHAGNESAALSNKSGSTVLALLPIGIPLVLIAIRSFLPSELSGFGIETLRFIGTPMIALMIGVVLGFFQYGRKWSMGRMGKVAERSIEKAALVIMITGAGGAFGHVIRASGVTETISGYVEGGGSLGLIFPFVLAAIFTTTTGSITVSMITTASIVMPMLSVLGISPELASALIGSGSFCVFHINSSFFWLLNRLHNIAPAILFRTYTAQSLCMGIGGLAVVLVLYLFGLR